jgi:hypothetical protein
MNISATFVTHMFLKTQSIAVGARGVPQTSTTIAYGLIIASGSKITKYFSN